MTLILKNREMEGILSMAELIPTVEEAFRELGQETAVNLPRARIRTAKRDSDESYFFNNIAGAVPGLAAMALRIDSSSSRDVIVDGTSRREYPGDFVGLVFLFSMATNELLAIMDDHYPSVMRVGATSGVGTRRLARRDSHVLGLFGSGHQAWTQAMAVCAVRPIRQIKVYSPNRDHRETFAVEMSRILEMDVVSVESPRDVVRDADIVTAATNAVEPVLEGEWLEPGMHVNSIVGGDAYLKRRELDDEALRRSDVIVVNFKPQIFLDKQGDIYEPLERGIIAEEKIQELGALLNGKAAGRTSPEQITLFKNNTGMGIQFAATAMKIYEKAKEKGIGTELPSELFTTRRGEERYSP